MWQRSTKCWEYDNKKAKAMPSRTYNLEERDKQISARCVADRMSDTDSVLENISGSEEEGRRERNGEVLSLIESRYSRDLRELKVKPHTLGRGKGKCKGPGARLCLVSAGAANMQEPRCRPYRGERPLDLPKVRRRKWNRVELGLPLFNWKYQSRYSDNNQPTSQVPDQVVTRGGVWLMGTQRVREERGDLCLLKRRGNHFSTEDKASVIVPCPRRRPFQSRCNYSTGFSMKPGASDEAITVKLKPTICIPEACYWGRKGERAFYSVFPLLSLSLHLL